MSIDNVIWPAPCWPPYGWDWRDERIARLQRENDVLARENRHLRERIRQLEGRIRPFFPYAPPVPLLKLPSGF